MNVKNYIAEMHETDKIAIELQYEELMRQEERQHRERMDTYAELRKAALERLVEKYGEEPATAALAE